MGGAWERLVRSIITILYATMPSRFPNDELLRSTLTEAENIVNSNHFLLGSSSELKAKSLYDDSAMLLRKCRLSSQQFANHFWKKWIAEYLPSLTCRAKWYDRQTSIQVGNLVIIVDPSHPRNVWLRGTVIETKVASDGQVRSAKVMTKLRVLDRPVTKLAVLEVASRRESGCEEASPHTEGILRQLHNHIRAAEG